MKIGYKNTFLKSIVILASGSFVAQLISVLSAPIFTRIFTADELGVYTYILSIASIFMAIVNGRYDMSIVTEEKEDNVNSLIKSSLIIGAFSSVIITFGYALYIGVFAHKMNYLYTIAFLLVLLLSYTVINVLTAYNNRKKEYKAITSVYIIRTACQNIGAIILGFFGLGASGLLISYTIGQLLGIKQQAKSLMPNIEKIKKVKLTQMIEVLKLHYKQPLFSVPAIFANSLSYSSVTLFIESLFGMSIVGYYSISVRLLGLPLALISGNVAKVFFETASREYNETKQFYSSFKKTVLFQTLLAIPMVICMMAFAPLACRLIFGPEWEKAGKYVVILAPMFGLRFIVSAISPGMIICSKQKMELVLQLVFLVASAGSFIISKILIFSIEYYLICISVSFSISYICFLIVLIKYSKGKSDTKKSVFNNKIIS